MKKAKPIFILLLLLTFTFYGTNDSLVKFSELKFKNSSEKEFFEAYSQQGVKKDIIDLMLMPYNRDNFFSSVKAHAMIAQFVTELKKETKGMSNAKKVKAVYKAVHRTFLKVYKLQNSFSDIFEKGEYNCVSSTALFAIVFDKMEIPFRIQEQPQHVYITAYPQDESMLIETTSPDNGYLKLSPTMVQKYVKYLLNNKLITQEEYDREPPESIFAKNYYTSSGIDLAKMPGIQYSNYALYYAEEGNYESALEEIKKAYVVDASLRNKYLLRSILLYALSKTNYKDNNHLDGLLCLSRFNNQNDPEINNTVVKNEFSRLMNEVLINNSDEQKTKQAFEAMYGCIQDSSLKNDISFAYHYELSRLALFNKADPTTTNEHLKIAYHINPKNVNLQGIILSHISNALEKSEQPERRLKVLSDYANTFNFLNDNEQFVIVVANCQLEMMYRSFFLKEGKDGEVFLKDFEKLMKSKKDIFPNETAVEKAFSEAAAYYYKLGNTAKTKSLLKTGLVYAPENFGLKMRLMQVR